MKSKQVVGFSMVVLTTIYLLSFTLQTSVNSDSSPTMGIGAALVFAFYCVAAIILTPSSIRLWRHKVRQDHQFVGLGWQILLAVNSAFSFILIAMLLWFCFIALKTFLTN